MAEYRGGERRRDRRIYRFAGGENPIEGFPMANEKRREFSLPPEIVEHIHSFMKGKEAARTAIVSKSLYKAWSKRPNLDFDERHFKRYAIFSEFTKKTMQRYEDLKVKIESFTLWLKDDFDSPTLADELIVTAMKLGAVDLNINFSSRSKLLYLPDDVLRSETLVGLSVTGCRIDLREVTCSKLKSLHLSVVRVKNGDLFRNLILKCPLIEKLVCADRLLSFKNPRDSENEIHKLQSLSLNLRNREALFFQDLLLKFPFLKNLAIGRIYNCRNIRICSQSLECISLVEPYEAVTAEFDVPNLRKFHLKGSAFCCLTFETTCGDDWESDIHIMHHQCSASWLSSLRKLLQDLSLSKVSLSMRVRYPTKYICDYTSCEPIPVVENLNIMDHVPHSGLLDALFLICRPKFVNQYCFAPGNSELLELLCKKLIDKRSENHCIPNPSMHGLEEVNVEVFEETIGEWWPLPWKTLLDDVNTQEFRFQLRWRRETCAP
ncbi:hypothetical protein C2S53_004260 [Perilla frutescens var. hirtella]|uniref:F-box domain-containing protein n=1 Tax=Perilla frutescens var. hirtella TaxID=608512 RepID=A0AAD4IP51_PERFH|nr:hypothetical protein C2S53_004260 [Perilla frutescens var. hirtella]